MSAGIIRRDGALLARYDRPGSVIAPVPIDPSILRRLQAWESYTGAGLVVMRPIEADGRTIGAVYVESDLSELQARAADSFASWASCSSRPLAGRRHRRFLVAPAACLAAAGFA